MSSGLKKTSTSAKPPSQQAMRRAELRAQGLREVRFWVPDLRNPKVLADLKRQAKLMARHPENDAIDDWLDNVRDPDIWK